LNVFSFGRKIQNLKYWNENNTPIMSWDFLEDNFTTMTKLLLTIKITNSIMTRPLLHDMLRHDNYCCWNVG